MEALGPWEKLGDTGAWSSFASVRSAQVSPKSPAFGKSWEQGTPAKTTAGGWQLLLERKAWARGR